ncbi:MAG: hypothetical protein Q8M19_10990 [Reyranella sp.]|nr:hypothetical protein [Reyranella sp.]
MAAPLSPNEEATLWRVHAATKLADLDMRHINRLASLDLVSLDRGAVTLTVLGKRRIEDSLPPERAAAQRLREAELFALFGRPTDSLAALDGTPPKPPPKARSKT